MTNEDKEKEASRNEILGLLREEEPWGEDVILRILRNKDLHNTYQQVPINFRVRLVVEQIRAVNRFNRSSTIMSLVFIGFAIFQVLPTVVPMILTVVRMIRR